MLTFVTSLLFDLFRKPLFVIEPSVGTQLIEIFNVIVELTNGEIGKIASEPYKGIDFRRENNFLHMMLIRVCRDGDEWKGCNYEQRNLNSIQRS